MLYKYSRPQVLLLTYTQNEFYQKVQMDLAIHSITPMDKYKAIKPSTKVYVVILTGPYNWTYGLTITRSIAPTNAYPIDK